MDYDRLGSMAGVGHYTIDRYGIASEHVSENWVNKYYEALEFFYLEPQHLGRKKYEKAKLDSLPKALLHLKKMEVTLNHIIAQFLLLAPDSHRNELFSLFFGKPVRGAFAMDGSDVDTKYRLQNATQPDLLFTSDKKVFSIEMKIGAKSNLAQVLKYALLGLAVELQAGSEREHYLGFLGTGPFANQWEERFHSFAELRHAIAEADLDSFLKKQPKHFRGYTERFGEIVGNLTFGIITYADLVALLLRQSPPMSDSAAGAQVYRKLIDGLVGEINRRKLNQ